MQNYEYAYLPGGSSFYYTEATYPQGHTERTIHAHERDELLVIDTVGSIQFACNGGFYTVHTPAAVWIRAGVFHQTVEVYDSDFHCAVIYHHEKIFSELPAQLLHRDFLSGCDMLALPLNGQQVEELTQLVKPMRNKGCPQFQRTLLLLCLFDRLSGYAARSGPALRVGNAPHYVFRLAAQMQDLQWQMPGLEQLAHQYFVGQSKLMADFKNIFGMPILTFRRHVQLQAAKILLETTNLDLAQIAEECGFTDDNYFIRVFRKYYGITPGGYRKSTKIRGGA